MQFRLFHSFGHINKLTFSHVHTQTDTHVLVRNCQIVYESWKSSIFFFVNEMKHFLETMSLAVLVYKKETKVVLTGTLLGISVGS